MKATGYTTCETCEGTYRGYKPRGWKTGDELCAWAHTEEDSHGWGRVPKCPGSYKPGKCSRLDDDYEAGKIYTT